MQEHTTEGFANSEQSMTVVVEDIKAEEVHNSDAKAVTTKTDENESSHPALG